MGFPKGASIPFGRERGLNPARDFNLIRQFSDCWRIAVSGISAPLDDRVLRLELSVSIPIFSSR
jgi:hypothetical protein